MINGVRLKVCGLTSLVDADAADAVGADYLGFIFYPKSPRFVTHAQYRAMAERLPPRKRVAVSVEPTPDELARLAELDFDFFQIHFNPETPIDTVATWMKCVEPSRLWLAPRLPPGSPLRPAWLPLAETFLIDTFHPEKLGGTGATGDWTTFKHLRENHAEKRWILSGGLSPDNIAEAVSATGAKFLDVNSGVEQAPGIKSPAKLKALVLALHNATKQDNPSYRA